MPRFTALLVLALLSRSVRAEESSAPPEPVCGNGMVEEGEGCDDGNLRDHDGCDASCQPERLGCAGTPLQPEISCDDEGDLCLPACVIETY